MNKIKKLYIIRKTVEANNIKEAIRLEKDIDPDDVYLDDDWKKMNDTLEFNKQAGFVLPQDKTKK